MWRRLLAARLDELIIFCSEEDDFDIVLRIACLLLLFDITVYIAYDQIYCPGAEIIVHNNCMTETAVQSCNYLNFNVIFQLLHEILDLTAI